VRSTQPFIPGGFELGGVMSTPAQIGAKCYREQRTLEMIAHFHSSIISR
jgi:hypothetical protein